MPAPTQTAPRCSTVWWRSSSGGIGASRPSLPCSRKYPDGIAQKYIKRLRKEVERSYDKVAGAVATAHRSIGCRPPAAAPRPHLRPERAHATPRASCHPDHPHRRRPAPARGRGDRARAGRRRRADLLARRNPGRAGQRDHDGRRRPQDRMSRGCALFVPTRCWSRSPKPRSSSDSIASAMPGSTSIRPCSWCG